MSQSAATAPRAIARPARRAAPTRPQLQLVSPAPRNRSNLPFVLLCSVVLSAGLLAVLWLNMLLSQGAYEAHALEERSALLADQEAAAKAAVAEASATGRLAQRAGALGLVPAGSPIFLHLPDGKVLGVAPKTPATDPLTVVDEPQAPATSPATTAPAQATPTPRTGAAGAASTTTAGAASTTAADAASTTAADAGGGR